MALLPPIPTGVPPGHSYWNDWYEKLRTLINSIQSGINWTLITGKPTTLSGYGITDPVELTTHKNTANGYAGLNASNVVDPDRLGTGVRDGTKFLRDDGVWTAGGGGGGVTDHGALTGLVDDDHTQYHNDARGDARYSLTGHNHTGVYQPLSVVLTATTASYTTALDTKLGGIAAGATANSSDAILLNRANHTGTQAGSTITGAFTAAGMTMATGKLLGRTTAATGAVEEITPNAANFTLSAGTLSPIYGTTAGTISEGNHGHAQLHNQSHAMTSSADHSAGNWKTFYSNGSGVVTELTLPATGYMKTTGTATAPVFDYPALYNVSVAAQGAGFATDTYLTGSNVVIAGRIQAKSIYRLRFDASKTAAGVATPVITIRTGTTATTADTSRAILTFPAQTAVVDTGIFEVVVTFRTIGATGVIQASGNLVHNLAATGLSTSNSPVVLATSAAFDTTTANLQIGVSVNGGTNAAWTVQQATAELLNLV